MDKPLAIVIVSGGMDSTTLLHYMLQKHRCVAVSVDYGQRHHKELGMAHLTCRVLGVEHVKIDMTNLRQLLSNSALTDTTRDLPHGHYAEESMKATIVPNRNMILLALATGVAVNRGAQVVAYGAHSGDHAIYPDCRESFASAMADAISLCDFSTPRLVRPFINNTKADIVKLGVELGVNFAQTWTCYQGGQIACGKCGTCVERLEAFDLTGTRDPLEYADREFWRSAVKGTASQPTLPKQPEHADCNISIRAANPQGSWPRTCRGCGISSVCKYGLKSD